MGRNTRQRGAIKRVLQRADRPLSPEEVLAIAKRDVGRLGIATVYRNLSKLVAERWLTPVEVAGEAARYELASLPHHHHFRCSACKRLFQVPCEVGPLDSAVPEGFKLSGHQLMLQGTCATCLN